MYVIGFTTKKHRHYLEPGCSTVFFINAIITFYTKEILLLWFIPPVSHFPLPFWQPITGHNYSKNSVLFLRINNSDI
jgi:hypothetical protein